MKNIEHYKEEQQKNNISFLIRGRIYCFFNFLEVLAGILTVGTETLKKSKACQFVEKKQSIWNDFVKCINVCIYCQWKSGKGVRKF